MCVLRVCVDTPAPPFTFSPHPANLLAFIDCHEQEMQGPRDKTVARTMWSEYKQRYTLKFLGAIGPNGAFTFVSTAYPGRITDPQITRLSGFVDTVHEFGITSADKGFMMQKAFSDVLHSLAVPPKAAQKQEAFSGQQMQGTARIARKRIHVERAFRRAQEFDILHRRIPILQVDLWGMIFRVCCRLTNFQPPIIADKATNAADTDALRHRKKQKKNKRKAAKT